MTQKGMNNRMECGLMQQQATASCTGTGAAHRFSLHFFYIYSRRVWQVGRDVSMFGGAVGEGEGGW